jgi:acetyltransferase-like isoleucine patch superfamily enzyme
VLLGVLHVARYGIGEYTSTRDANHLRKPEIAIRDGGHSAKPIHIGEEVWIGPDATVLGGVAIGPGQPSEPTS